MRKKYLSALLFGALLFASAGTFTSCKDYDDDINNLQEQINAVASDLNDLKTKVEAMGGVKDVTFADGVLTVVSDKGNTTYNIPDKVGVTKVELINGTLYVDGVEAGKAQKVEVKGGVLYIDGEPQELAVNFESNVVAVIDKAAGIYTLTVNNQTIQLPIAFADVEIKTEGVYFTAINEDASQPAYGIHWARSTKEVKWDGPKGDIAKDQLVIGQTTTARATVRPINYDLKANENKLTLVSSTGEIAKAKVVVYESQDNGPLHTDSRATYSTENLKQGDYVLGIELNSDLTDREVIESFATADGNGNVKYALALDGVVVTDYDFVIDTQLKADTQTSCADPDLGKVLIGGHAANEPKGVPVGTHMLSYNDGRIYDMKVEIDPSSESDASVYGVKINNDGTITAGTDAENRTFKFLVTLIDVNGNISKTEAFDIKFKKAEAPTVTELTPTAYTVTPLKDKSLVINLGDVFTSLSDEDAIALKNEGRDAVKWNVEKQDGAFLVTNAELQNITYYADAACTQAIDLNDKLEGEKVKTIKYAKLPISDYNVDAKAGEHLLSIELIRKVGSIPSDGVDKTIKKVNVPVDVKLPAWEDLFAQSTNNWSESGEYTSRIVNFDTSGGKASIELDAYIVNGKSGADKESIIVDYIEANLDGRNVDIRQNKDNSNTTSSAVLLTYDASGVTKDDDLLVRNATVNFLYKIGPFDIYKKNVKINVKSMYEDLKLVWLNDKGVETSGPAILNGDNTINGTGSEKSSKINGLAFAFYKQYVEAGDVDSQWDVFNVEGVANNGPQKLEVSTSLTKPNDQKTINFVWEATGENSGEVTVAVDHAHTGKVVEGVTVYDKPSTIKLTPKAGALSSGTIKVTFMDAMGVKHTSEVTFAK